MKNLFLETCECINGLGKTASDVAFIGSGDGEYGSTWDDFAALANIEYDNGFGGAEVAEDLVVVFKDGSWLSRGEYDGSEWWNYNKKPEAPATYKPIRHVITSTSGWRSVAEIDAEDKL